MLKVFASLVSLAQQPDPNNPQGGVNANPSAVGMPGRDLIQQVEALLRALGSAGLEATDPVDAMGLWRMLRLHVDPTGGGGRRGRRRLGERLGLVTPALAGPLVLETGWRALVAPSETELADTDAQMLINTESGTREPAQTRTDPDRHTTARTVGLHHAA